MAEKALLKLNEGLAKYNKSKDEVDTDEDDNKVKVKVNAMVDTTEEKVAFNEEVQHVKLILAKVSVLIGSNGMHEGILTMCD